MPRGGEGSSSLPHAQALFPHASLLMPPERAACTCRASPEGCWKRGVPPQRVFSLGERVGACTQREWGHKGAPTPLGCLAPPSAPGGTAAFGGLLPGPLTLLQATIFNLYFFFFLHGFTELIQPGYF